MRLHPEKAPLRACQLPSCSKNFGTMFDGSGSGKRWPRFFLPLVGAAGMFAGQPNNWVHFPPLALLYPFCLYLLALGGKNTRDTLLQCFWLGLAGNCATLYWLVHPMHDVAALPYPAAGACVVLLSCYLALFTALSGLGMRGLALLCARFGKKGRTSILGPCLAALLSGLVYGGFEVLIGRLFTGFPWLSLSSAFAFLPAWVQTASVTGSYGLSAIYASVGSLAAVFFMAPSLKQKTAAGLLGLCLCAFQPIYGLHRLESQPRHVAETDLSVLMIQGNVDQNQKWEPAFQKGTLDLYRELSRKGLARYEETHGKGARPALVLWPETALPFYFQLHREYAAEVYAFARQYNVNLMFGTLGLGDEGAGVNSLFNRLYLVSNRGGIAGWYDKSHLVPFGEYIPFAAHIAFLQKLLQGVDFSSGTQAKAMRLELPARPRDPLADAPLLPRLNGGPQAISQGDATPGRELSLGALICYEAIFPYLAQRRVEEGATILVNVSNDAWFRRSSAPLQHLSLTAMRAVEQARPIVRCTNTGITAIIDAYGRIEAYADRMFSTGSFAGVAAPSTEITPFHRLFPFHEYFLVIMALASLVCHQYFKLGIVREPHVSVK